MKPYLNRKQLSSLLREQIHHYIHHHPEDGWAKNKTSLFIMANNLYDRKSADRHRILRGWLEPGLAAEKAGEKEPLSHNTYDDIRLEGKDIDNYLSGDYLFVAEYSRTPGQDRKGKTVIKKPGLLFYLLARLTEMEEPDIISAFYAGEGLELSEYETYCAYDVFEYYFDKTGLSVKEFCHSLALEGMEGFKPSTFSKLLLRGTGIAKNDDEFIAVGDDITLEQFSKLAGVLQIPDKWKNFCLCRLAHKEDPFTYREGYLDSLEDGTGEPEYLASLLRQMGAEEKGQVLGTVSQLYDCLGFTVLGLPPSWMEQPDNDGTAVLKIRKPVKKNSSNNAGEGMYEMKLGDYRDVLEEVASYARSALEDMLRQKDI
ncbi:MAG: hypothetical protein NC307_12205 [Roseburia sp.]|nr:hypothetical protein [Roseburia sp.]